VFPPTGADSSVRRAAGQHADRERTPRRIGGTTSARAVQPIVVDHERVRHEHHLASRFA
jgi:hypothetical protein